MGARRPNLIHGTMAERRIQIVKQDSQKKKRRGNKSEKRVHVDKYANQETVHSDRSKYALKQGLDRNLRIEASRISKEKKIPFGDALEIAKKAIAERAKREEEIARKGSRWW